MGNFLRRINWVAVAIVLVVLVVVYFGYKLIPVYWQAQKVSNELSALKQEAANIKLVDRDPREEKLIDEAIQRIRNVGVDDEYLDVYFSPDYTSIHAEYSVEVKFFFGKSKRIQFHRTQSIPRDDI